MRLQLRPVSLRQFLPFLETRMERPASLLDFSQAFLQPLKFHTNLRFHGAL